MQFDKQAAKIQKQAWKLINKLQSEGKLTRQQVFEYSQDISYGCFSLEAAEKVLKELQNVK